MIYGMTGGQAASTSPLGSFTSTSMEGTIFRPFDLCNLVLGAGAPFAARFAVTQPVSLINSIKRCLATPGFAFMEVLSPCPTQFGRRNRFETPAAMMKLLMERCISKEEAARLSVGELKDMIVTGEFINEQP